LAENTYLGFTIYSTVITVKPFRSKNLPPINPVIGIVAVFMIVSVFLSYAGVTYE